MTNIEQLIYNKYIAVTRSKQNKPFKLRKDFTNFEKDSSYVYVKKLSLFFSKHPNIDIDSFFAAPFEIYEEPGEVYIDYYTTRAAIRAYTIAQKKKEDLSPSKQHDKIKESLQFIGMFCLKANIPLTEYLYHVNGCTLTWMQHYREKKINIYSLFEVGDVIHSMSTVEQDERDLFLGETQNMLATYKTRYYNSPSTVLLVKEGTRKVSDFVRANLKT